MRLTPNGDGLVVVGIAIGVDVCPEEEEETPPPPVEAKVVAGAEPLLSFMWILVAVAVAVAVVLLLLDWLESARVRGTGRGRAGKAICCKTPKSGMNRSYVFCVFC